METLSLEMWVESGLNSNNLGCHGATVGRIGSTWVDLGPMLRRCLSQGNGLEMLVESGLNSDNLGNEVGIWIEQQ